VAHVNQALGPREFICRRSGLKFIISSYCTRCYIKFPRCLYTASKSNL